MIRLPKYLTRVTPLSKALAMVFFVTLPFSGFYLGVRYQKSVSPNLPSIGVVQVTPPEMTVAVTKEAGPGYEVATVGNDVPAVFPGDLNADGKIETVKIFRDNIYSRSLPLVVVVFGPNEEGGKEVYRIRMDANELGEAQVINNFQGYSRPAVMFQPISTGYGSGFTSHLDFVVYGENFHFKER